MSDDRGEDLSLFAPLDPIVAIDDALVYWRHLCTLAGRKPRLRRDWHAFLDLGRDLRALRDCYVVAHHPRVRAELLREARAVSTRLHRGVHRLGIAKRAFDEADAGIGSRPSRLGLAPDGNVRG